MVFWHWFQDTGWFAKQIHITYLGGYSQVMSTAGVGFTLDKMLKRISEVTNEPLLSSETNAIIWLGCSQVKDSVDRVLKKVKLSSSKCSYAHGCLFFFFNIRNGSAWLYSGQKFSPC